MKRQKAIPETMVPDIHGYEADDTLAGDRDGNRLQTMLSAMTLREKVAQMMIASFRLWQEAPETVNADMPAVETPSAKITELNDAIRDLILCNHFGGILLFGENFLDTEQSLRLTSEIKSVNRDGGGLPQLFFVDQEGGNVNRIPWSTVGVSNMALGATGNPEHARRMAAIHGEEISLLGIHADFAPVVDINSNPANPVIGVRSFSDDARTVADFGSAYVAGLHDAGIIAALKHFPGHGNTDTDSHTGFPLVNSTLAELEQKELIPFRAAMDAGADMIMTAHIQFPQIEKETAVSVSTGKQVYLPATMSRTILTEILRERMGFEGVIVSDALDMAAIRANFTMEDTLKQAINAGVDFLILPAVTDAGLFKSQKVWVDTAVALVENGEIDEKRIDDSVLRILKLKEKYGVLNQTDFTVSDERIAAARHGIGSKAHREAEWRIAEDALTLVKNENGAFPLRMKPGEKTLILFAETCANLTGTGELVRRLLEDRQAMPEGAEIVVMKSTKENAAECLQASLCVDHVILVHRFYAQACVDPSTETGFSSGVFDQMIRALHERGKTVIEVSCSLPYDAARFTEADAILLAWFGSVMKELPAEGASWSSALPAGLLACFGLGKTNGALPVGIPALDDKYQLTNTILWPRGHAVPETRRPSV